MGTAPGWLAPDATTGAVPGEPKTVPAIRNHIVGNCGSTVHFSTHRETPDSSGNELRGLPKPDVVGSLTYGLRLHTTTDSCRESPCHQQTAEDFGFSQGEHQPPVDHGYLRSITARSSSAGSPGGSAAGTPPTCGPPRHPARGSCAHRSAGLFACRCGPAARTRRAAALR